MIQIFDLVRPYLSSNRRSPSIEQERASTYEEALEKIQQQLMSTLVDYR